MELDDLPRYDLSPDAARALDARLRAELGRGAGRGRVGRAWLLVVEPALVYGMALIYTSWAVYAALVG